jgi:uncharacterized membrane protein YkvA (DUF1232 family)
MFLRLFRRVRATGKNLIIAWRAMRNPATPLIAKLLLATIAIYVISPIDLLPDVFPVLGWIDDISMLAFILPALLNLLPADVLLAAKTRT